MYADNGLTNVLLDDGGAVVQLLVFAGPELGGTAVPQVGMVDLLFIAMFVAAAKRFGMPVRRLRWSLALVAASAGAAVYLGQVTLPLLPFLATAYLCCWTGHARRRSTPTGAPATATPAGR